MSTPTNPQREYPNTYVVQDRSNTQEMARLLIQDRMLTSGMGGVLPEQPNPASLHSILDIGCGTGGWLLETASTYPTISRLVGIDVSKLMLDHARAEAQTQQLADRVEFHVMDVLRMLEFPEASFDLVNIRLGLSYVRTWDWHKLLEEFQRVALTDGVMRITEADVIESNSPALTRICAIGLQSLYQAGHFFRPENDGLTSGLADVLRQHGLQDVQTRAHLLEYRASDVPTWQPFYDNIAHMYRTFLPFFRKWTRVPADYETLYQQALQEIQQPDFVAVWKYVTIWGRKP